MTDSVRLKWLLTESDARAGLEAGTLPLLSVSISWGVRRRESSDTTTRAAAEDLSNYKLCRAGDLVINRMRAFQGALGIAPEDGVVSPDYAVLRVDPTVDKRWLNYFLSSEFTVATMASLVRGIGGTEAGNVRTPRLNVSDLQSMTVPAVSAEEQRAIADHLDRESARIDTLIEEQQRLIEMLHARRQAVIESAVGRGLDPAAPMQSSGLFWTTEVPQHWTVANIRKVATMKTGHTPSRSKPEYWVDCTIPWFTLADVWQLRDGRQTYLGETVNLISEVGLANSSAELLPAGTVVLSRTASVGFSGIMPVEMATSQDFWNWIPGDRLIAEYLMWTFRAMRNEIQSLMIGSTHKTIYQPTAAAFRVPLPPVAEQQRIATYLNDQTRKIDTLIAESERLIDLSRERRAALITAAVTGQIDVREMV
ncbi:restriction endonuclease subunit S [Gordonia sp. HS-NH1]|uniref:restriction endonuclease subunit S n=1 Tax=Gordonia sp. HS-NH1 TaxID=1435068 RepID=UPI0006E2387A|nr:restriction endonuclease subunit S [Gordonia sp. HS-NH1]